MSLQGVLPFVFDFPPQQRIEIEVSSAAGRDQAGKGCGRNESPRDFHPSDRPARQTPPPPLSASPVIQNQQTPQGA